MSMLQERRRGVICRSRSFYKISGMMALIVDCSIRSSSDGGGSPFDSQP